MKLVFIAGPFAGPTAWDIAHNVRAAEEVGLMVAQAGVMPFIPHANTHLFFGQLTEDFWKEGIKKILMLCDASVFLPNWTQSSGSRDEMELCIYSRMPTLVLKHGADDFQTQINEFFKTL